MSVEMGWKNAMGRGKVTGAYTEDYSRAALASSSVDLWEQGRVHQPLLKCHHPC